MDMPVDLLAARYRPSARSISLASTDCSILDVPVMCPRTEFDQLRERLHSLPSEIYTLIYDATFALDASTFKPRDRLVDEHYKQPFQLQINRRYRRLFLPHYYSPGAQWTIPREDYSRTMDLWLGSLSIEVVTRLRLSRPDLILQSESVVGGPGREESTSETQEVLRENKGACHCFLKDAHKCEHTRSRYTVRFVDAGFFISETEVRTQSR